MAIDTLATKYGVDKSTVEDALIANDLDFNSYEYDQKQHRLIKLYIEYLKAKEEVKTARDAFRYTDGEETVDKTKIYEQYRRYALDLYDEWKQEKEKYAKQQNDSNSFFKIRGRAGEINVRTR